MVLMKLAVRSGVISYALETQPTVRMSHHLSSTACISHFKPPSKTKNLQLAMLNSLFPMWFNYHPSINEITKINHRSKYSIRSSSSIKTNNESITKFVSSHLKIGLVVYSASDPDPTQFDLTCPRSSLNLFLQIFFFSNPYSFNVKLCTKHLYVT